MGNISSCQQGMTLAHLIEKGSISDLEGFLRKTFGAER
jgi:hypothetical protein